MMSDKTKALIIDFHECFGTEAGKRVLANLKKEAFFRSTVPMNMPAEEVKQLAGSRNVIIYIMDMLDKEIPI